MLTVTDIFAGAGGSSTGAASVPGVEVKLAANHWQGTKRERVRLAGNAVTPPAARDLVACIAESLGVTA